jgi:glycosyltransferase 2 family protein
MTKQSNWLSFFLKILVSAALITFFVWHVNFFHLLAAISQTKVSYLLIGLVLYPVGQIICAIKWRYLARALGINKDLKPMVGLYFIGMFFNLFLPTSIGGDITRGLYLNPSGKKSRSFLSVLAERATGVLSMLILASVAMLSVYGAPLPKLLRYGFPILSFAVFIFIWILPHLVRKTRTRLKTLIDEELMVFWDHPHIGIVAILYSMLFHGILVAIHICIARSLSLNIPVPYHFITMSLASLASLIPSFNGIGPRDGTYLYLLSLIGIPDAYALLFAILWFVTMTISGLIGCVVYLMRGLSPAPAASMANQKS